MGQLLQAEKITLDWGYMQLVKAGDFLLHGDDSLSTAAAGGSLVLDRQPKRQRIEPPTGLLMIGLQCQQQLYVSCVSAGTFLFDCFSEHGLHLAHFAVDDGGRIYGKDFRLWKSYRFTVLDDLSFPTVQLPLPRVSTEHSTHLGPHPGGPHGGIGAFAIDYVLRSLFRQAYGDSTGPWRIDALWMAPDYTIEGFPQHIPPHNGEIVAPLAFDGHWAPLYGLDSPSGWQWFYLDGVADRLTLAMCVFATQLTDLLGVPFLGMKHRRLYHQEDLSSCGTIVIAHTMAILGLAGEFLNDDILRLHAWLRHHFAFMDDQLAGGPSSDSSGLQGELAQLLATKGVPAGVAFERAGDAITALGADKLSAATRAKNQWQALKGVSSQSKKPFKFVLAWELQAHIEKRAKEKHGAHLPRDRKKERKADDIPAVPDPGHLRLQDNLFKDFAGDPVPQISFEDVYNDARGVALCTKADALPFIQQAKSISAMALALLVVEEVPTSERGVAKVGDIRFPATYTATNDPVLIKGALIQLGDLSVERHGPPDPMASTSLATNMVLKLAVYRDELGADWQEFTKAPIKHVLAVVPALRLCKSSPCPDGSR